MSSEHLASAQVELKGDLGASWNILDGASANYTDLGIARRFGEAAAAYSLRDIGAINGPVIRVRREPQDTTAAIDDEQNFSASQVQSGALEDWVNGKLETTLPADVATAAAAFSLRKVKASYSGNAVRIRRSSDDAEVNVAFDSDDKVSTNSSISVVSGTVSDTTLGDFISGTDAFVHTWYDQTIDLTQLSTYYDTPFTASNFGVTNATEEYGTYLGRDNVVKITTTAGNGQKYHQKDFGIGAGESVRVTAEIYIPSSNTTIDSFSFSEKFDVTGYDRKQGLITPTQDQWVDIDFNYVQVDDTNQRIQFWSSSAATPTANTDVTGDVIYFRNLIVTRVTKANQDATQETSANQPKIAESGSLLADGIDFDGSASYLDGTASLGATATVGAFIVHKPDDTDANRYLIDNRDATNDGMRIMQREESSGNYRVSMDTTEVNSESGSVTTNETLLTAIQSSTALTLFKNAVSQATAADDAISVTAAFRIGANRVSLGTYFDGTMKEIILFTSDQTDNRFKIESNINNYYGLYNDANDTSDTEWQFHNTETGTSANGTNGFVFKNSDADTGIASLELKQGIVSGDVIYYSFFYDRTDGSPTVRLASDETDTASGVSNDISIGTVTGFKSGTLTATGTGSFFMIADNDNPSDFTISNFKMSRIERNGFVETLYDQSGNGNNATQGTAANQPQIVRNGALIIETQKKPAIDMINGTITKLAMASEINMQSLFAVNSIPNVGGTAQVIVGKIDTNNKYVRYKGSGANFAPMANNASESAQAPNSPQLVFAKTYHLLEYNRDDSNDNTIFVSGTQATLSTNTITSDIPINGIGVRQSTADPHSGLIQEIIMFEVDKSGDRVDLRNDIANFYNITLS